MENSFRVRVDRIFGSLASASSPSLSPCANLSSLWSLTDEEVEKREWNREKDIPETEITSYPSNLDGFFGKQPSSVDFRKRIEQDIEDLDDDVDDDDDDDDDVVEGDTGGRGSSSRSVKPADYNDEEWEIRSSIGLDCALDNEEEEDEYDKVAVGREKAGERLYMTEFNDYAIEVNSCNVLPKSLKDVARDPRANHMAAKARLQEDAEAAGSFDSLRVSDKTLPAAAGAKIITSEDSANLKSILKRKEHQVDSKLHKRVRFDPGCKTDSKEESEGTKDLATEACLMEDDTVSKKASFTPQDQSRVPDYIRNPTKYTHYTFDSSSDIDEESNRGAYVDFLTMLKKPNTSESQADEVFDLPKAVTFTPRKKSGDTCMMVKQGSEFPQKPEDVGKEFMHPKGIPLGIAAGDSQESEVCAMEEDEPELVASKISSSSLQKPSRQYRTKVKSDLEE